MILLILLKLLYCYSICCYQCDTVSADGNCDSCVSGTVRQGVICMDSCPSGYSDSASVCSESGELGLVSAEFGDERTYTATEIGGFSASGSGFYDTPNLVPTFDRGFYSSSSSYLISTNSYLISPDFSIKFYFLPLNSGTIFSISSLLDLSFSGTTLTFSVSLYDQTSSTQITKDFLVSFSSDAWLNVVFYVSQDSGSSISFTVNVNGVISSQSFTDVEAAKITSSSVYIGETDGNTAEGFWFQFELWNKISTSVFAEHDLNTCLFLQYFDGEYCAECEVSCDSRVNCWTGSVCSACAFEQCYPCNGFDSVDCTGCTNGETAPYCCDIYCLSCISLTECSICADGKTLIDGVCLEGLPYGLTDYSVENPVEVISAVFDELEFEDFNGLECGSDSTTYYPFSEGESDDPVPSKNRGVYFDGNSFLQYSESVILAHVFTVSLLLRPDSITSCSILSISDYLYINTADPMVKMKLLDYQGNSQLEEFNWGGLSIEQTWVYLTIVAYIVSTDTWIDLYINNDLYTSSNTGVFRMPSLSLKLGSGDDINFSGFIYSIQIIQGSSVSLSSPTLCTTSSDTDCVVDCNYLTYLNSLGTCSDCLDSCELGCFSSTCQICEDISCKECSSFLQYDCILCENGYYLSNGSCQGCHSTCKTCSGGEVDDCLTCNDDLQVLNGECVNQCRTECYSTCSSCDLCDFVGCSSCPDGLFELFGTCSECPLGYNVVGDECVLEFEVVFDMKFDSLNGLVNDFVSGIVGVAGSSQQFYPDFEANDPIPGYKRGFYFNGKSSVVSITEQDNNSNMLTLAPEFSFEIWFYAQGSTGTLISKQSSDNADPIFIVYLQNTCIYLEAGLSNSSISIIEMAEIEKYEWTYLSITFKMYTEGDFQLFYNKNSEITEIPTDEYLLDQFHSTKITIGAQLKDENSYTEYFKGFIYQIKFYNKAQSYPIYANSACDSDCSVCSSTGTCLVPCNFGYFLNESCEKCKECPYGCTSNSNNCSFCSDPLCSVCSSFESCSNCTENAGLNEKKCECLSGYIEVEFSCVLCNQVFNDCKKCSNKLCTECYEGYYLDSGKCLSCEDGCEDCTKEKCLKCVENSFMKNEKCDCYQGYEGKNCSFVGFYLKIVYKEDLVFTLAFSETLKKDLKDSQLAAYIRNASIQFSIEKSSDTEYAVEFSSENIIKNNTLLTLTLSSTILSVNNSILSTTVYYLTLPAYKPSTAKTNWKLYRKIYSILCYIIVPLIIISIIIPENLPVIWNFLNNLQLLSFLYLLNLDFSDLTKGATIGLRNYAFFPNAFQSFSGVSHNFPRIYTIGYHQNSFIKNSGNFFTMLLISLILFMLSKICIFVLKISKKEKFSKAFILFCQEFKYKFFCRFLIQSFLELLLLAGVAMRSSEFNSASQGFNFALSFIVIVMFIQMMYTGSFPGIFLLTLYKRKEILDADQILMSKFGSLFEEFTSAAGEMKCQYYTIFFIRRFVYVIIVLFFGSYPIAQVTVFLFFSIIVIFTQTLLLTHFKKPFKNRWLNYSNSIFELLLTIIGILLVPYCFNPTKSLRDGLDIPIFILINLIILITFLPSIMNTIRYLKLKYGKSIITIIPVCQIENIQQCHYEEGKSNMDYSDAPMFNSPDMSFTAHKEHDLFERSDYSFPNDKVRKLHHLNEDVPDGQLSDERFTKGHISKSMIYISPRNKN